MNDLKANEENDEESIGVAGIKERLKSNESGFIKDISL